MHTKCIANGPSGSPAIAQESGLCHNEPTMHITFVRPNLTDYRSADALEPLAFAVLAGLTPPEVELALYDDRIEPVPYDEPTDLVALSVETYTARRAYYHAAQFSRRGVPVVLGGLHPSVVPEEAQHYADAVVIGEAEAVWPTLIGNAQAGRLQRVYQADQSPALRGVRFDRRLFHGKRYAPLDLVQFGRGCRFACDFCSVHAFYGTHLRQRPVPEVIAEIETLAHPFLFFVDDNILANPSRAEELFRALIPLRRRWACQVSIDVAWEPRLLDLMARSGCLAVFVGLESLDARNLALMHKAWNRRGGDYAAALREFYERGLMVFGTFVFGYDHDTPAAFDATLEFALRSRLALAQFNPLTPMPGTPLYARLQAEGRLIYPHWWLDDGFRYGAAVFHPKGMTSDELSEGCFRVRREFNRYSAIASRALAPQMNCRTPQHLFIFLAANLVSRREILQKQGQMLGGPASQPALETP